MGVDHFLGRDPRRGLTFTLGEELYGAFGGIFGGVVAAMALRAAREHGAARIPVSLDCQFLRPLRAGEVRAVASVEREGRTLTFVRVQVVGGDDRVAAACAVTLAAPEALHPLDVEEVDPSPAVPHAEGTELGAMAPILETLAPRFHLREDGHVESTLLVPWDEPGTGPEAACMAADLSVGPPVGILLGRRELRLATPNPDLALRFVDQGVDGEVSGVTRLERVVGGLAITRIAVRSPSGLHAVGVSCTLMLATG